MKKLPILMMCSLMTICCFAGCGEDQQDTSQILQDSVVSQTSEMNFKTEDESKTPENNTEHHQIDDLKDGDTIPVKNSEIQKYLDLNNKDGIMVQTMDVNYLTKDKSYVEKKYYAMDFSSYGIVSTLQDDTTETLLYDFDSKIEYFYDNTTNKYFVLEDDSERPTEYKSHLYDINDTFTVQDGQYILSNSGTKMKFKWNPDGDGLIVTTSANDIDLIEARVTVEQVSDMHGASLYDLSEFAIIKKGIEVEAPDDDFNDMYGGTRSEGLHQEVQDYFKAAKAKQS